MNKEDALTKLAALEAETKALRAIIEAPEVPTRWKPKGGDEFWFVSAHGRTLLTPFSGGRVEHGNCFRTQAQADIAAKAVSRTLKVVAYALEVDPDAGEFTRNRGWTAVRFKGGWDAVYRRSCCSESAYVHTEGQAKQLAAMLNAEGV
jgi:hypothetical protein